jgi:hypothetical protein
MIFPGGQLTVDTQPLDKHLTNLTISSCDHTWTQHLYRNTVLQWIRSQSWTYSALETFSGLELWNVCYRDWFQDKL